MIESFWRTLHLLSFDIPAFLLVILLHEYFHVVAARKLTGLDAILFRPRQHFDLFGLLLPITLIITGFPVIFGWGNRIEANFTDNRNKVGCEMVFASSGLVGNLSLCLLCGMIISIIPASETLFDISRTPFGVFLFTLLFRIFSISLAIALVNFLPLPPFDGGYLLFALLPAKFSAWREKLQMVNLLLVLTLIMTGAAGAIFIIPFKFFTELLCGGMSAYVLQPASFAQDFLMR